MEHHYLVKFVNTLGQAVELGMFKDWGNAHAAAITLIHMLKCQAFEISYGWRWSLTAGPQNEQGVLYIHKD